MRWAVVEGPYWKEPTKEEKYETFSEPESDEVAEVKPQKPLKHGDYVYTDLVDGVYYKGGIAFTSEDSKSDLYDEWKDVIIRDSLAKASLIKIRNVASGTFFTKGKLNELGLFIKERAIEVVFVNTTMTPLQVQKLEK